MEWQINCYLYYEDVLLNDWQMLLVMAAVYLLVLLILGYIHRRSRLLKNQPHITRQEAISAAVIAFSMFVLSNLSFTFRDAAVSRVTGAGVLFVRTMADLCGLVLLYAHDRLRSEMNLRIELTAMDSVLNRQYEQFRLAEANNETMHRVYHDLKHQIAFIRAETDAEKKESYLADLERVVTQHETEANTGNPVLDTILTSKLQACSENGITLTYFADAAPLQYLNTMDICSIFGNAIDNAIEYEKTLDDPEKRLIKVTVYTQNHMVMIRVENYCEEIIPLVNGLPRTTKQDKRMHGYGLKSIRSIAEKYGGHLHISQEDNWFSVGILIPMEE